MSKAFPIIRILLGWALVSFANGQSNTACQGTALDWYTEFTGETPCQTYERLRQICTPDYELGVLNSNDTSNTPPDNCDDAQGDCCCNSVSFALSMLCVNCQRDIGTGSGHDAGKGLYEKYLTRSDASQCSPHVEKSLPTFVQDRACSTQLKIENSLYKLFWNDGSWFYTATKNFTLVDRTLSNNTFMQCPSTLSLSTLSTAAALQTTISPANSLSSSSSVTTTSSLVAVQSQSKVAPSPLSRPGPIAGLVIGLLVLLGCSTTFLCILLRRRASRLRIVQASITATPFVGENSQLSAPMSKSDLMTLTTTSRMVSTTDSRTSPYVRLDSIPSGRSIPLLPPGPPLQRPSSREVSLERHVDAGLVGAALGRSHSGRLPPAYGEQM